MQHLESLKNNLLESSDGNTDVDATLRRISTQALLHIGSRSFSHFLNAVERYLPLLRTLVSGSLSGAPGATNPQARADVLGAAASFWRFNPQMIGVVFEKLMQYQIVDPTDVVRWSFGRGEENAERFGTEEWDLMKVALDKANGRVVVAKRRVAALRKEEDETRARAMASGGAGMEVDGDAKLGKSQQALQTD
jgi:nuclear cap-binding protein subunit 1